MISVIVPIYNTEQNLAECIDSVMGSSYEDFEVILVNDGSTDNSLAICREYCGKDKRVRLINQENRGVSAARNRAIDISRGDWIVFVDSDDTISPQFLEMVAEEDKADVLIFDFIKPNQRAVKKSNILFCKEERVSLVDKLLKGRQLTEGGNTNLRSPCGKAYRRTVIQRYSIRFSSDIFMGEDILFNVEFFLRAQCCKYISVPVYLYKVRMGSVTHSFVPGLAENYFSFQRKLRAILSEQNAFSELEGAYYADALENMAYILIKEIFSPCSNKKYSENRELCKKVRMDDIFAQALKQNHKTGILPRRVMLGFFRIKWYGVVSIICRLSHFCIDRMDRRQETQQA